MNHRKLRHNTIEVYISIHNMNRILAKTEDRFSRIIPLHVSLTSQFYFKKVTVTLGLASQSIILKYVSLFSVNPFFIDIRVQHRVALIEI